MTPEERWRRVQALCEQIEALPEAERAAALAREADESVRQEAERMLVALREEELARQAPRPEHEEMLPARIGAYRVTGLLGRGGTSTVYAAERDGQRVAVKVLHGYWNGPEAVERFEREQEILKRLAHPGICQVLDTGVTPDQQPYLVLDRVDGQPIDVYCDSRELGLLERIGLVLSACDAVGAAHRSLVVHLDLKPGNILVTADGQVRLLDFGTAKLLDPGGALTTTRHLTPLYASPEQLRGEPVTTACDIYGLGMVLYELLAGAGPYRSASIVSVAERASGFGATVPMAEKATEEAARERGLPLERLRRELRGDIETVVAKALAPEPGGRYGNAAEFAGDLRRYVERRPVLARRQTLGYRLQRYAGRNRGAVAVTLLLAAGLAGAMGYGYWQQRRAWEEEKRAAAVGRFLDLMITTSNPIYGGKADMTVLELVGKAEKRLAGGAMPDEATAAVLESSLGNVLFQGGEPEHGLTVVRRGVDRALRTGDTQAMAETTASLGMILISLGDCKEAVRVFGQTDPAVRTSRILPATMAAYLATRDQVRATCEGDMSGALTVEAVKLARQIPEGGSRIAKALLLNAYGRVLTRQRKFGEALAVCEEGLAVAKADPDGRNAQVALLQTRAAAEYLNGDVARAGRTLEAAVDLADGYAAPFEAIRLHVMAGQRVAEAGRKERAMELAERAMVLLDQHKKELAGTRWMVLIDAALTFYRAGHCERVPALVREVDTLTGGKMPAQWKGNRLGVEAYCLNETGKRADARRVAGEALAAAGPVWAPGSAIRKRLEALAAPE